jgi:predicted ester cyclase
MSEEFNAKIRRAVEAWTTDNPDRLDEAFATDIVYHMPPFPDLIGTEAQKQFIATFRAAFPDFQVTFDEDIVEGDRSTHRWHCQGTYSGQSPLLPVPPTGNQSTASGSLILHWQDGKVTEAWHFGDWLGWLQGAGVLPPLG